MRQLFIICAFTSWLASCADELHQHGIEIVDQLAVAPDVDPALGFQIKMPEDIIEVGQDVQTCFVPEIDFTTDVYVRRADAYQGSLGHHVVIFGSAVPRKAGEIFDCSDLSLMSSLLPMITPQQARGSAEDDKREIPEGFYLRIPAGSRIVLQSHYVNYTDNPIRTADIVNFETLPSVEGLVEANFFVLSNNTMTVPVGTSTTTYECDVDADTNLLFALGHMHENGASISMTRRALGASEDEILYEVDEWTSAMRDDSPTNAYAPATPLVLRQGDHLTLTCGYNNTTNASIEWPHEMCVLFSAYWPARSDTFVICE